MRLQTLLSAHEILHTRQQWRPDWSRKHHALELAILNRIAALEAAEQWRARWRDFSVKCNIQRRSWISGYNLLNSFLESNDPEVKGID